MISLDAIAKLISEEIFYDGSPLVVVLSVSEDNSTDKGYLLEQLHTSNRWPILVFNVNCQLKGNTYTEIQKHSSYTILISGQCQEGEKLRSVSMK